MSGKRAAGRELNHDNWNEEEEGEDAGEFRKANEDELQRRVRKVSKRRIVPGDSENAPNVNAFSGFGGFKASTNMTTSTPAATSSPFSFLAQIPSASAIPKTNGTTEAKSSAQIEYLSKMKALNIAVTDWIKTHVDESPLCILTPIFRDYEKYMKEFDELKKKREVEEKTKPKDNEPKPAAPAPAAPSTANFTFGKPSIPASSTSSSTSNSGSSSSTFSNFTFTQKPAESPPKPAGITFGAGFSSIAPPPSVSSTFSFGLTSNPLATSSTPFFGGLSSTSTPMTFGGIAPAAASTTETTEEDADEAPPKNEFVPVVEDDSLYSKRCKVFVKGEKDFADRGVGTLYLKKVDDTKTQMIVRADTNLGNILLNIMIVDGLPVSRMGKNNVMVVCVPTPDAKPPPTSVLLRVKTTEEADDLLAIINKHKKTSG